MVTVVKPVASDKEQLDRLRQQNFGVKEIEGNRHEVHKGNCVAVLARSGKLLDLAMQPGYLVGGEVMHLLDQGYQKFLAGPNKKVPARADQLRELHDFQEALLDALGVDSLYNTSLGTISERYHYDRVKGRANP